MSDKELLPFGATILGDVFSAIGVPGGGTFSDLARRHRDKQKHKAAEILIEEVSNGYHGKIRFDEHDIDPLLEISYRFSKAVNDGAAKENLRLLSQVICGLKKNKALEPDKFRKWCNVIEGLTRDEIVALGKAFATRKNLPKGAPVSGELGFWVAFKKSLQEGGYSDDEIYALCTAVSRTGLLTPQSVLNGEIFGDTIWLMELGELAQLTT